MSVYFARSGRYVKIGYSADPISRASTLTTSGLRPADLPRAADVTLLGWIPGDRRAETKMHLRFRAHRAPGEWFEIDSDDEIRDLIWSDPRGVDMQRMSGQCVLLMCRYVHVTRDELEAAGVRVEATDMAEVLASPDFMAGVAAS